MKKKLGKKLWLNKETVRNLSKRDLGYAVGGGQTALCEDTSSSCTDTCWVCPTRPTCVATVCDPC